MPALRGPNLAREIADTTKTPYSDGREIAHPPSTELKPVWRIDGSFRGSWQTVFEGGGGGGVSSIVACLKFDY